MLVRGCAAVLGRKALSWLSFMLFVRGNSQRLRELFEIPNQSPTSGPLGVGHTREAVKI